jgi:hypothetical protein
MCFAILETVEIGVSLLERSIRGKSTLYRESSVPYLELPSTTTKYCGPVGATLPIIVFSIQLAAASPMAERRLTSVIQASREPGGPPSRLKEVTTSCFHCLSEVLDPVGTLAIPVKSPTTSKLVRHTGNLVQVAVLSFKVWESKLNGNPNCLSADSNTVLL